MIKSPKKKLAFVSSFHPRKCGIATFTSDLIENLSLASKGNMDPLVVAMKQDYQLKYDDPVKFEIRQNVKNDYICAADYINFSHVDAVSIQHEYGLFGGEAGSYLTLLLNRLKAPVIATLHTVLGDPDDNHFKSLLDLSNASHKVVTMNERGVDILREVYGIQKDKICLIPHGIPNLPFVDNNYYKHKFGMEGRKTILTFGLLNENKGIEVMLRAMPDIIKAKPKALYVVLGMTHPSVIKYEGESYRFRLQNLVKELGLQEHVIFHNRFVSDEELHNFLCAADVYVTPYLNREQLTSGTLAFAVGTGKAVVSTPYWAATELLADGRGKLVPFGDSKKMAKTILHILQDDSVFYSLRRKAYDYGRSRIWPKIGQSYWKMFKDKELQIAARTRIAPSVAEPTSSFEVPEPSLAHLRKLTDDTGLLQHAKYIIPNREHGYCTDDNARGLIAMTRYYAQYTDPDAMHFFDTYLSFLLNAQQSDGSVRNFMNFDRQWQKNEAENDSVGRFLWALGTVMANPPSQTYLSILKDSFDHSVKLVEKQSPRGMAYSIFGMSDYLRQFPGASEIKRILTIAADKLVSLFQDNATDQWCWFEDIITYDNAVLPHALFVAWLILHNDMYLDVARKSCDFLLDQTITGGHFSFVGCKGWYPKGGKKASFDQQPIEAASTVMMLKSAYQATEHNEYLRFQREAFDWFLGKNDLQVPLYDFSTKGCADGLMQGGVNLNQGAESLLSFLNALLTMVESYSLLEKVLNAQITQRKAVACQPERPAASKDKPSVSIGEYGPKKTSPKTGKKSGNFRQKTST